MLAMMERVAVYVGGTAALCAAVYVLFGPDRLWKRQGRCVGLVNLGNTCFINAVLQGLASMPAVCEWVDKLSHRFHGRLIRCLHAILTALSCPNDTEHGPIAPLSLVDALQSHDWKIDYHQQDALELFHVLLMTVEEEMVLGDNIFSDLIHSSECAQEKLSLQTQGSALTKCGWTVVPQQLPSCPLKGMLTSTLVCQNCYYHFPKQYEYFDSLSLPIPKLFGSVTLSGCLRQYMSATVVSDFHCPHCSPGDEEGGTSMKRSCLKKLSIGRLPECLLIHIIRAEWSAGGVVTRNDTPISYTHVLDVSPFISTQRSCHYKLCSVVQHMGGVSSGHYITYRLCGRSWVYTSDTTVYSVTQDEVLAADAYLLLYQKMKN